MNPESRMNDQHDASACSEEGDQLRDKREQATAASRGCGASGDRHRCRRADLAQTRSSRLRPRDHSIRRRGESVWWLRRFLTVSDLGGG